MHTYVYMSNYTVSCTSTIRVIIRTIIFVCTYPYTSNYTHQCISTIFALGFGKYIRYCTKVTHLSRIFCQNIQHHNKST